MAGAGRQAGRAQEAGQDERASILGVAKHRLPGYLPIFTVAVIFLLVVAVVRCWDSIEEIIRYYPYLLSKYMPAVVTVLIAVEGGIMGRTALLLQLQREKAVEEGRQEGRQEGIQEGIQKGRHEGVQEGIRKGIQEAIQFLEKSGKGDIAEALRRAQSNGWGSDQR